ncbi:hypothetical protein [Sediminitomix flava]|nr:hypothetical protein [Sediminitomix flava]
MLNGSGTQRGLFFFFSIIGMLCGYFAISLDWTVLINIVLGLFSSFFLVLSADILFFSKRMISVHNGNVRIKKGIISKTQIIPLSEIAEAEFTYKKRFKDGKEVNQRRKLKLCNLQEILREHKPVGLTLYSKLNTRIDIKAYEYEADDFIFFLKEFKLSFSEATATIQEKVKKITSQTEKLILSDKVLIRDLERNLQDIHLSIYRKHLSIFRKDAYSEGVIYQRQQEDGRFLYCMNEEFLEGVTEDMIEAAKNLILSTKENIKVVKSRIVTYEQILAKMRVIKSTHEQRQKLQKATEKLNLLQKRNINRKQDLEMLESSSEFLHQLEQLTENISNIDTLQESELIRNEMNLWQHNDLTNPDLLKEINNILERTNDSNDNKLK